MTSRREFLESGLAIPAVSLAGGPAWAAIGSSPGRTPQRPYRFVFDRRFRAAAEAAAVAESQDIGLLDYAGDPTSIWYHGLDRQWRERPLVIAGVTLDSGLFVLETLAADRGLRVWYHAIHESAPTGETVHVVQRPAFGPRGHELSAAGSAWPGLLGARLSNLHDDADTVRPAGGPSVTITHRNDTNRLHSWVIGPAARVRRRSNAAGRG